MYQAQEHIVKFYSKCGEFRAADQYTDVTIQCEDGSFKCHRLILASASPYFHKMLSSDFKEGKKDATIPLKVNAKIFEKVLKFIYTGDVAVDCIDFFGLLQAADYFEVQGIEDLCTQFIQKIHMNLGETIFEVLAFVSRTGRVRLMHFLCEDIAVQLNTLSQSEVFLKMPFHDLCALFDQLPIRNKEVQCSAVIRWIEYNREERRQYFSQIFEKYDFGNMSMHYRNRLASNMYNPAAVLLDVDENMDLPSKCVPRNGSLYVYVKNSEENTVSIFSINSSSECSVTSNKLNWSGKDKWQWIRSAAVDNLYLYSLEYGRRNYGHVEQSFNFSTLNNMQLNKSLQPPPLIFGDVSMCSLHNTIYVYNQTRDQSTTRTSSPSSVVFSDEELSRGVYLYQSELDKWFPAPAMHTSVVDASMIVCDDILYLVGGWEIGSHFSSFLQALDVRTGIWQNLPNSSWYKTGADCCLLNGNIYACGGSTDGQVVEVYNPTAGCWELAKMTVMQKPHRYHKVASFFNEMWVMGNSINDFSAKDTSVEIYNPNQNQWRTSQSLTNAIQNCSMNASACSVMDCVNL